MASGTEAGLNQEGCGRAEAGAEGDQGAEFAGCLMAIDSDPFDR